MMESENKFKKGDWVVNSEYNEVLQIKEINGNAFEPYKPYKGYMSFYYTIQTTGSFYTRLALPHEIPNYKHNFKTYI